MGGKEVPMQHSGSADSRWIDLYVAGRLSATDETAFEEHLIDCAVCREEVQAAEGLRRDLRKVAAEEIWRHATAKTAAQKLGWLARWAPRMPGLRRAAVVALALLLAALPVWLWIGRRQLERELSEARANLAVATRPYPALARAAAQTERLERDLAAERRARQGLSQELDRLRLSPGSTVFASLGFLRDGPDADQVVHLARDPGWIFLAIDPPAAGGGRYDVTLLRSDGQTLLTGKSLAPDPLYETLVQPVHSTVLSPGRYRLRVRPSGGPPSAARETTFRAVR